MLKLLMRWAAAQSWDVALISSGQMIPRPSSSQPVASAPLQEQQHLQDEITALKGAFQEEKELNAQRHKDLLALLTTLQAKLSPLAP